MTSTSTSDTAVAHSAARSTIASSSWRETCLIAARAGGERERCPVPSPCRRNNSGSSVSMVVFELGTISPILEDSAGLAAGLSSHGNAAADWVGIRDLHGESWAGASEAWSPDECRIVADGSPDALRRDGKAAQFHAEVSESIADGVGDRGAWRDRAYLADSANAEGGHGRRHLGVQQLERRQGGGGGDEVVHHRPVDQLTGFAVVPQLLGERRAEPLCQCPPDLPVHDLRVHHRAGVVDHHEAHDVE